MTVDDRDNFGKEVVADVRAADRVGVVDIGSNTVRLVVYDTANRLPIPIFNEKAQCGLGRSLGKTGRLSPRGVTEALRSLARFSRLAEAMAVGHLEIVATAAVRDAADGPAFVGEAERVAGHPVQVLSGAEEARLAAVGLLNGVPAADGALGDLGGGSLDLVGLEHGSIGAFATLPVGHLRLTEDSGGDREAARRRVDEALDAVGWLPTTKGRTLYAVGGSWRALARIFIEQTHHPLHVLDNYTVDFFDALRLADLVAGLSRSTLQTVSSLSSRRIETLPFAATAMAGILEHAKPARVTFSGFGMREGQMLELLPEPLRRQDPLISACEGQAERTGRFAQHGQEMLDWMAPLFPEETAGQRRLRLAACLLSDIGWSEHPDYRAEHAFHRVLRVPYAGLIHAERVALALAVFVRYGGQPNNPMTGPTKRLMDGASIARAEIVGLALRLAQTLSGGAPGLLAQTRLKVEKDRLVLCLPDDAAVFLSDAVDRRFKQLAAAVKMKPRIG